MGVLSPLSPERGRRQNKILTDILRIPGSLSEIYCSGGARRNGIRSPPTPLTAEAATRSASQGLNSLRCVHQGAPLASSSTASDPISGHAGAGGARNRAISDRISANNCRDTATSVI